MTCIFLISLLCVGASMVRENDACNLFGKSRKKTGLTEENKAKDSEFLIVGAGLHATTLLYQLQKIAPTKKFPINIVDMESKLGSGLPFDGTHLTGENAAYTSVQTIDVKKQCNPSCPNPDIKEFFKAKAEKTNNEYYRNVLEAQFGHKYPQEPLQRRDMGEYLEKRFAQFVDKCKQVGYMLKTTHGEATKIARKNSGFEVILRNDVALYTTDIFLATGLWNEERFKDVKTFFYSPTRRMDVKGIVHNEHVGIFGAGRAAADAALTIALNFGIFDKDDDGEWVYEPSEATEGFRMIMYSHIGQLPTISTVKYGNLLYSFLTKEKIQEERGKNDGFLPLNAFLKLMKSELVHSYQFELSRYEDYSAVTESKTKDMTPDEFFDFIDEVLYGDKVHEERLEADIKRVREKLQGSDHPVVIQNFFFEAASRVLNKYMKYFAAEDVIEFKQKYAARIMKFASPLELRTAEKLRALIKVDRLEIKSLEGNCDFQKDEQKKQVHLECERENGKKIIEHPYFVDAREQNGMIRKNPSDFVKSLVNSGLIKPTCVKFSTEEKGKEALALYGPELVNDLGDGNYCYETDGVEFNTRTMQAGTHDGGAIYVSGPFISGRIPIWENFYTAVYTAETVATMIEASHFAHYQPTVDKK